MQLLSTLFLELGLKIPQLQNFRYDAPLLKKRAFFTLQGDVQVPVESFTKHLKVFDWGDLQQTSSVK